MKPGGRRLAAAIASLAAVLALFTGAGCLRQKDGVRAIIPLDAAGLSARAVVLWVGAHPDDEAVVAGALLAQLSRSGRRVFVLSLTRGEGTGIRGSEADEGVAAARGREYCLACSLYRAQDCASEAFPSVAHLGREDGRFEESPGEVVEAWRRLGHGDPVACVEEWIRAVRPEWILTLDPDHGMYGHPEHRAAAEITLAAARALWREVPSRVYAAENRFASILSSNLDPGPVTLEIPGEVACEPRRTCFEIGAEAAAVYASQGLADLRAVPPEERFTFLRALFF